MKHNPYKIICDAMAVQPPVRAKLGLQPNSQGVRQAQKIKAGQVPAHSKPAEKQAASKFLNQVGGSHA